MAAWLVIRLRFLIVPAWIAAAVLAYVALPPLGQGATLASLEPRNAPAVRTEQDMNRLFSVPILARTAIVQRVPGGLPPGSEQRALATAHQVSGHPTPGLPGLRAALPISNVGGLIPGSRERDTTLITYLFFDPDRSLETQVDTAHTYAREHARAGYVGVAGVAAARVGQWSRIQSALPIVTLATIGLILLVVGIHFRSLIAPLVTLSAAGLAYLVTIGVLGWIGRREGLQVPQEVEPVMIVLLLGVTTDYSVFFLSSARRGLAGGDRAAGAAQESARVNIPIIFTAGLIVAASTAALVVGNSKFFQSFGPGMAVTALVAMLVALTFVPALLGVLGRAAFWPHLPNERHLQEVEPSRWRVAIARATTHRWAAAAIALVCIAGLVVAALGLRDARLGLGLTRDLPQSSEPARAQRAAQQGFAPGVLSPTVVLAQAPGIAHRGEQLAALQRELEHEPGIAGVLGPAQQPAGLGSGVALSRNGDAARFVLFLANDPLNAHAIDVVKRLKADLPRLGREAGLQGARLRLAGDTALAQETIAGIKSDMVRVGLAALGANLLLLILFLRTLGPPLYLLFASVLALAATLGITSYVFIGALGWDGLTYYVPFAAAVLLVALGSDYNVFVVGRIWQRARELPLREAVAEATPRAGRAITVAGLSLGLSFAILAIVPLRSFREFAFAMSVGVLLETFIVRSLMVPSLISLIGSRRLRRAERRRQRERAAAAGASSAERYAA